MSAIPPDLPPSDISPLLKASIALSRQVQAGQARSEQTEVTNRFSLNTREIIALFTRFRLNSIRFEQLKSISLAQLSPREKEFVRFLQRNQHYFRMLSALDRNPESLSPEDVKIAAQLAGDALVLSDEDLKYLRDLPLRPAQSAEREEKPGSTHSFDADDLNAMLKKLSAQPLTLERLDTLRIRPGQLTADEERMLQFLRSRPVHGMLQKITPVHNGQLTPEAIRILASLIWNPAIYGAVPIAFINSPMDEEAVEQPEPVDAVDGILPVGQQGPRRAARMRKMKWKADRLLGLLNRLSPDGHVSLARLRSYQPSDPEEARMVSALRQEKVFQALAELDEDGSDISREDIKLALAEGALVLYDPSLVLIILP